MSLIMDFVIGEGFLVILRIGVGNKKTGVAS